jgi:hypothetical protein
MTTVEQMSRVYSPAEQQAFTDAEDELRASGLLVDGRTPVAVKNAEIIFNYFETHLDIPVTVENIRAVVKGYVDHLTWTSQVAKDYQKSDTAEIALVNRWLEQGSGRLLISGGEQGRENTLNLLNYCRKVGGVDWHNLSKGLEVLNPMSSGVNAPTLHWKAVTPSSGFTNRTGLPNHAEKPQPEPEKKNDRQYIHGRLNRAWKDPNAPPAVQVDPDEGGGWRRVCEALAKDGSHSEQAEITAVMERARTNGKSWQEVYQLMQQVKRDRAGYRSFDRKGL